MGARPSPPRWQRTRAPLTRGLRDGARRERIKQLNAARSAEPPSKPRGLYKRLSLRAAQPGQRASVAQYKKLLASVRPRGEAGKMRRRMAAEELDEVARLDAKLKAMKAELRAAVLATGSHLMDIHGIGPAGAARILADVGDVARFPNRDHFASRVRHRPHRRLQRPAHPPPAVAGGEPPHQPRALHGRDRPAPQRHPR